MILYRSMLPNCYHLVLVIVSWLSQILPIFWKRLLSLSFSTIGLMCASGSAKPTPSWAWRAGSQQLILRQNSSAIQSPPSHLAKLVAHALASRNPAPPQVTLLLHRPELSAQWDKAGHYIDVVTKGLSDPRAGFQIE